MNCSLVIRAYNEEQHIGRLLEGVRHQTLQDVEIILVDSGSTDATAAIAAQYGARVVHIPPGEFTFGRSLNLGLGAAACELGCHCQRPCLPGLSRLAGTPARTVFRPAGCPDLWQAARRRENSMFSEQQIFSRWYPPASAAHQNHPFCNNANAAITAVGVGSTPLR